MADSARAEGLKRSFWESLGDFAIGAGAALAVNWFQKKKGLKAEDVSGPKELSRIMVEVALHRDEDERAMVMNDFADLDLTNLLAAQTNRQFRIPRPYKVENGKIVLGDGIGIPYEPGSENKMVNVFVAMRRAFHPNRYEPEEIIDPDTKQKIPNQKRVEAEEEDALHKAYVERLKEMNELPPHKLDARIEFIHDDKAKQFWDRMVEDAKRAFNKIPFERLDEGAQELLGRLQQVKGARR